MLTLKDTIVYAYGIPIDIQPGWLNWDAENGVLCYPGGDPIEDVRTLKFFLIDRRGHWPTQ